MWSRLLILALFLVPAQGLVTLAFAGAKERVRALAPNGIVYVIDEQGTELIKQNADKAFVPASVAKVVTAWLAMEVLGPDYRFKTHFYLDENRVLYVRGGGDPMLVSEELALLAPELVAAIGPEPITGMVLDPSYYPEKVDIPGIENNSRSYNALNSALAVNFNTINAVRRGSSVVSGEKQTPITPLAISQFKARGPKGRGRISLAKDPELSLLYAGELLEAFIEQAGGKVDGKITIGPVPPGLQPVYVHLQSRTLAAIINLLLIGSNNYIANQVFLEIGAARYGGPVSLEKSLKVANEMLAQHGLQDDIYMEEGSGLSRGNRFTAQGLAKVLDLFVTYAELMQGRDGGTNKTGTMSGIRTLAGYADTANHGRVRFVIALRGGGRLRYSVLKAIEQGL
ncbi:D-alanyl-D-alanine carboxypeptidase/D-alanyl-D-alanine-endopeptidase [Methyloceanibacter caenitepidi]|uniref:D-alanyl-D-alanine carboxypeptidase n=1 Tax=Methyloceanibacter caenitepidi TaxID=1384459 RepID=A0A0A8K2V7_9HYPH|nr:D-alanyl-D-alanine carboxypeptidase [Methyloceanibacter caenitepidi]BAQ16842.1 D-alanyl-D-alanine carboxypeptidase [Methyloceanibacter caenitepidi]